MSDAESGLPNAEEKWLGGPPWLQNAYSTLGVPMGAKWPEVVAAHQMLVAKHHPAKNPGDMRTLKLMKNINLAFSRLRELYGEALVRSITLQVLREFKVV